MRIGVACVDDDFIFTGNLRPTLDGWNDALLLSDRRLLLDPPGKQAADNTFMNEAVADAELAPAGQLRDAS